ADGSVSKTAELLGISRKTLWEKMKRLKLREAVEEAELRQVDAGCQ
ncbi:MAG TPA: helix-turn-helix domain-containing protein, partial [Variovorax sp.]